MRSPNFIDTHMKARKGSAPSPLWQIVAIKEEGIALSGPGPCRGYQVVTLDEFDAQWNVVWCRSPSGHENNEAHDRFCAHMNGHTVCTFCKRDENFVFRGGE